MLKKLVLIASALLIALAFSGCSKKPRRPNPLDTVLDGGSRGTGYQDGGLNPTAVDGSELPQSRALDSDDWAARAQRGVLNDVLFGFDSASIAPQERNKLDAAVTYLRNNPGARLLLEGHCDWRGTGEYNLALGDRRAKAVQTYLQNNGVDGSKLQTLSKGDLNATEGASAEQMARERKVELLVVR